MDITAVVSLVGMFSVGLLCIYKNEFAAAHAMRQAGSNDKTLEKQLRSIAYVSGWFFCALSVAGAIIILITYIR